MSHRWITVVLTFLVAASTAHGAEFVPIRNYQNVGDSPFPEFGIGDALIIENLDTGAVTQPGLSVSSSNKNAIREGHSVKTEDGQAGYAYEAFPTSCATTFPLQCPAKVTLEFNTEAFGQLPTYVGFVWTDAVRASENSNGPWVRVNVTDVKGVVSENLINELPIESVLEDQYADDTLISFVNDAGIQRLDITVVTDGTDSGGHLAIDHIQYGVAALSGDTNQDGDVDFMDLMVLESEFGNEEANWGTGDFNFNNQTEFSDFLAMAQNFGQVRDMPGNQASTPEPGAGQQVLVGLILLLGLRRRLKMPY